MTRTGDGNRPVRTDPEPARWTQGRLFLRRHGQAKMCRTADAARVGGAYLAPKVKPVPEKQARVPGGVERAARRVVAGPIRALRSLGRAGRPLGSAVGVAVLLAVLAGCGVLPGSAEARNVILIVGDGMGAAQRDAIQLADVGAHGTLAMDAMPTAGLVGTNSAGRSSPVTDSAAAATAMATGVKTLDRRVGVDPEGNPLPTVLEQAAAAGKATGLVTTSAVTDATPAAFAAHVEDRGRRRQIARQYLASGGPDVILGGGRRFFEPSEGGSDDLTARARGRGYGYAAGPADLEQTGAAEPRLLGLFAKGAMYDDDSESGGGSYAPDVPLPEMTQKAISVLSEDRQGFFLLVEEEAIDAMGHAGNPGAMLQAGMALDRAVEVAKDFAEKDGRTLLIVVGDHETCGMTVEAPDGGGSAEGDGDGPFAVAGSDQEFVLDCSTSEHTAVDVPLTAMGPGAERLEGTYENTRIYEAMARAMGIEAAG